MPEYLKYIVVIILMAMIQLLLNGLMLIIACVSLGVLFSIIFKKQSFFLFQVLLIELLIGIGYGIFAWSNNDQLKYLSLNTQQPAFGWAATVILLNTITVFLCIATPVSFLRVWRNGNKEPVERKKSNNLIN
ncbi:MAG: hypothetical protein ABIR18_01425 [Chitinophagaceae bacterium]